MFNRKLLCDKVARVNLTEIMLVIVQVILTAAGAPDAYTYIIVSFFCK